MRRLSPLLFHVRSWFIDHRSFISVNGSLILVGLILAAPLLQTASLCTDDGALHILRTVALDRALHDGLLYPRWFPDLAYGYGFPFFNYREPLGYYLLEMIHLLGASVPLALNLVLAGSFIASGLTMNLWVSEVFDRPAGFVAAVVYLAAPYTLIDSFVRANLPEVIAFALMPLILWSFGRLIAHGGRKYFVCAVLSLAALLLTHNISSLIFAPFLVAYCLLCAASSSHWTRDSLRLTFHAVRPALFAFLLALALTAFFWLPALTEGQAAQLYLTHSARGNDYHFNFATVGEVLGPPGSSDPALLNPPLRIILGWAQMMLAVLGVVLIKRLPTREQRAHVVFMALAGGFFIIMALSVSLPVWDALPLIRFVQFPWRFVGRALLPISFLAGAAAYAVFHSWRFTSHASERSLSVGRLAFLLLFTLPALLSAAPLLYPRVCPGKSALSIADVFAYERATGHIGVDPLGAYLPVSVVERPTSSPLEAQYAAHEPIQRFDRSTLPAGAQVLVETYGLNSAAIVLDSPIGFQATYLTFDFPGWQAAIDGAPVPIVPSDPNGLITFEIPAGQHQIEVRFGETPARTLADVISLAALVVFGFAVVRLRGGRGIHPSAESENSDSSLPVSSPSARRAAWRILPPAFFLLVPIVFLLLKVLLVDPQLTPLRQTQLHNGILSGVQHSTQIDFGDRMRLLGYTLSPGSAPSGDRVRLDLYWRALQPIGQNDQTTVGVIDANGEVWSPKTLDRPRDYQDYPPTNTWSPDAYVVDSFELPINPGTPPGDYAIFAEVFERGSLLPLPAHAAAPHPDSRPSAALIGPLEVTRAAQTFTPGELGIYNLKADQALTRDFKLTGANWDRADVLSGETVLLTLFWQALQNPAQDDAATIELIDEHNAVVLKQDFPLGNGRYPTSQWGANEQIADLNRVRIPADLASGSYRWRVSIGGSEPIERLPRRRSKARSIRRWGIV